MFVGCCGAISPITKVISAGSEGRLSRYYYDADFADFADTKRSEGPFRK